MKKAAYSVVLCILLLIVFGCGAGQLRNINSSYDWSKESNKCIIIGKVDIEAKGAIGITTWKAIDLKKYPGGSVSHLPVGEYFFVSLEPGDYIIEKTWVGFGALGAMGYGYPASVYIRFTAIPNEIVYIGNLSVIHKFVPLREGMAGYDKEVLDEYETATSEFRKQYPTITGNIKKILIN